MGLMPSEAKALETMINIHGWDVVVAHIADMFSAVESPNLPSYSRLSSGLRLVTRFAKSRPFEKLKLLLVEEAG